MKRLLSTICMMLCCSVSLGQDYATAFAKLDHVYVGEDFTAAASTAVNDESGAVDAVLAGGDNTGDIDEAGPTAWLPTSLHLDGSADYIDLDSTVSLAGSLTMVAWVKRDTTNTLDVLFGTALNTYFARYDGDSTDFTYRVDGSFNTVTHGVDTTGWHHIAITRDGSNNWDFYFDGSLVSDDDATVAGTFGVEFFGAKNGPVDYLDGSLAQLGIADEALTATDIAQLYAGPPSGPAIPIVHYYRSQMSQ